MAIKINNAKVEWAGYEFACVVDDEEVFDVIFGDLDTLRKKNAGGHGKIMFRAIYKSEWMPTIERATGALLD